MTKINWKPGTMVYPVPPALISCGSVEQPNVMTAAWTGIINRVDDFFETLNKYIYLIKICKHSAATED